MEREVVAVWNRIRRAARKYTDTRPRGMHPANRWLGLAATVGVAALLLWGLVPRREEHAATAVFYAIAACVVLAALFVWLASRARRVAGGENAQQRDFLEQRAVILASMISRGVSELASHQESLPTQLQLMARQQQNELLRQRGLWDELEATEKMLASAAHGGWTEEEAGATYQWCEHLRVLRWVLRLDKDLVPLEELPGPDWTSVQETLAERFEDPKPMLAAWDVRVERDKAAEYTARALAEFAHRGVYQDGVSDISSMLRWRNFVSGTSRELKLGRVAMSDLDEDRLQMIASVSAARWQYAAYLVDLLAGDEIVTLSGWETARAELEAQMVEADQGNWEEHTVTDDEPSETRSRGGE